MTLENMRRFVKQQHWIFAKTYADKAPHEYMLRKNLVGDEDEYLDFARTILKHGILMEFWDVEYRYVYLDEHLYWVMDPISENTTLINRSNVKDYELIIVPRIQTRQQFQGGFQKHHIEESEDDYMTYPKQVMTIKELEEMGFTKDWLMYVYRCHNNLRNGIAWKISYARNSKILFDTEALEKYRKAQCGGGRY